MSQTIKKELLPKLRDRYAKRGIKGKTVLINEVCKDWGYERKYAIKLLNGTGGKKGKGQKKRGRPARYGKEVIEVLLSLAKASDWPCGKRLAVIKRLWLPYYEGAYGKLEPEIRKQLESVSAAQIERWTPKIGPVVKLRKSWGGMVEITKSNEHESKKKKTRQCV